jgi:hypothetical protein
MSEPRDPRDENGPELSPDSERFVDAVAEAYAPEPPTPARAQAFDVALQSRLEAPVRPSVWKPALATALALSAVGWLLLPPAETGREESGTIAGSAVPAGDPAPGSEDIAHGSTEASAELAAAALASLVEQGVDEAVPLEDEVPGLFTASDLLELDDANADEFLPDDYLAIGGILLDG